MKAYREAAYLTKGQLAELLARAAESDPTRYTSVSVRNLERLERGDIQPRAKTAVSIAYVLKVGVAELFPNGLASFNNNPAGITRRPSHE